MNVYKMKPILKLILADILAIENEIHIIFEIVFTRELRKLSRGDFFILTFSPSIFWGSESFNGELKSRSKAVMIRTPGMEVSGRFVFALADDHKSVTRRLIRGSIRVQLARYESDVQCETMVHAFRVFRSAVWIRPMAPFRRPRHGKPARFRECVAQAIVDDERSITRKGRSIRARVIQQLHATRASWREIILDAIHFLILSRQSRKLRLTTLLSFLTGLKFLTQFLFFFVFYISLYNLFCVISWCSALYFHNISGRLQN